MSGGLQRLGKDYDKAPKAELQSFAQALSCSEASSSKTKGKASAEAPVKVTDKQEKPNQYCNILNPLVQRTTTGQQLWQHMLNPNGD